jgi:hypothetical protein
MKKKFGKLSKEKQEKRESEYHRMKPEEFDRLMTRARRYTPHTIRLPAAWIDGLEAMAELEGEPGYHTMVQRWIEERLHQESRLIVQDVSSKDSGSLEAAGSKEDPTRGRAELAPSLKLPTIADGG